MLKVILSGAFIIAAAFMAAYYSNRQLEAPLPQQRIAAPFTSRRRRRDEVEGQIRNRTLECMICLENVRINDRIWMCANCMNVGHLDQCLSIFTNGGGRTCPSCRVDIRDILPLRFTCMCGRVENPRVNSQRPFTCSSCIRCGHDCHPGPC